MRPPRTSPWGPLQNSEILAEGVLLITTADHSGLHLKPEVSNAIPLEIVQSFMHGPAWPEADIEMPIALALLIDAEKIPARVANRFTSCTDRGAGTSPMTALATKAVHAAARYDYPKAIRPLLQILAKAKAGYWNLGGTPADGRDASLNVQISEETAAALVTLREYALTFTDHPDNTADNGVFAIVEDDGYALKFGAALAAKLLLRHEYLAGPGSNKTSPGADADTDADTDTA